ncbi:type VI secretion system Vgr family protein [Psychrobacter celer]|uniref:type VI secretion system Vgr family protein n=1 Tax=Psychrobacter celer TaxID=306572 RepID=UPI003FD087A1
MRTIGIHTPFGRELSFVELNGSEGLSTLFEYRLVLTSKNPNLAATDIIGQTIAVTIDTKGGERILNGLVTDFGYLSEDEDEQSYHLYTCIMRPNMWYLTQRYDSRVFVDKDILEITRTILDEFGFPYEIQCLNSYRKYGHSTQYQETSFNYLNRLFEQEGLYYYFTHTEGSNTLIIVDDNSAHPPIQGNPAIPYHSAVTPGTPDKNYIDIWQQSDRLATKSVSVNDHSYKLANRKLDHKSSTHELGGINTEHYDFYTGFSTKEDAASYAQVRSQDYNAQSKRITAAGNVLTIAPGQTFTLSRHPHNAANTEHLIIHAEYELKEAGYASGTQQSHYRIRFTAIPLTYQYRPPRATPKPQIIGSQAATVTGPAGEEVHTNPYGDIKVQFHWDRYGPKNEKSSDWIRVAQGSAGGSFGSINTPRIGEEVLIDFINGDSDRPIVIGRLYNSANPPPWGYPQAAKQSGIKSKSFNSPLENYNELMFNDDAGFELVNLQAQRDLSSLVKNDETRRVNRNRTTTIDNDETVTVHGKRTETVDKDEHITIHQNRTEVVDKDETITIHQNRKERVDENETIDIGGNRTETVHKSEKILIKGNRDKNINGNDTLNVDKNRKENVHKSRSLNVDKNNTELVKMAKSVTVGLAYATQVGTIMNTAVGIMQTEQIGRIKKSFVGKSYSITAGDEFKITVGKSSLVMNADGSIIITGSTIITQAEKENKVIGKDVLINPPGASNNGEDEPAQIGPDGLPILGSDSDEYWFNQDNPGKAFLDQALQAGKDALGITYGVTKDGIQKFPGRTKASMLTAMIQQGKRAGVDYVSVSAGGGFMNGSIEGAMSVNVHTGEVYFPKNVNASVNNSKYPNVSAQVGFGSILNNNGKSDADATNDILSGQGHAVSTGAGPFFGSYDSTDDGKVTGVSGGVSKSIGSKKNKNSVDVSKGSSNMEISSDYKYNKKTGVFTYLGK